MHAAGRARAHMGDDGWYAFPPDAGFGDRWIHVDRRTGWIRMRRTENGNWTYSGTTRLIGAARQPRMCVVGIEGKQYLRHRLMALACGKMSIEQFRDPSVVVMHLRRREEDAYPDDRPDNLEIGTHKDNNADPGRKKTTQKASGHPIRITRIATGESTDFPSLLVAARSLGVKVGNLNHYMNGANGMKSMPGSARGIFVAEYADAFATADAVKIAGAAGNLWLSPSRPNEVLRQLRTDMFVTTTLKAGEGGYVQISLDNGKTEKLHRLVIKTLRPGAFEDKLATMPLGSTEADLQIDHIDGDESNNAIDNLRLVTRSEHARKHAFAVEWVGPGGEILGTFECAADAEAVRGTAGQLLHQSNIRAVCNGSVRHAGGRIFRWKDAEAVAAARAVKIAKRQRKEI